VLEIKNLSVEYAGKTAVDGVSFTVQDGETVSIVGESGSGKSTILRAVQGLLGREGRVSAGSVSFNGVELTALKNEELRRYRGAVIATVPQQAGLSMDPITKIGRQFHEVLSTKEKLTRKEAEARAAACMRDLSLKDPERILKTYPSMLSGGTNQRVALAMALVLQPQLILADEPTSALDVTVQVQVVNTMLELKQRSEAAILMVTHNIGVVAQMSDHVGVMYNGELVEWGTADDILRTPAHPYTYTLMASVLRMNGSLPQVKAVYREPCETGCVFYARCPRACERCRSEKPLMRELSPGHRVKCHPEVSHGE